MAKALGRGLDSLIDDTTPLLKIYRTSRNEFPATGQEILAWAGDTIYNTSGWGVCKYNGEDSDFPWDFDTFHLAEVEYWTTLPSDPTQQSNPAELTRKIETLVQTLRSEK